MRGTRRVTSYRSMVAGLLLALIVAGMLAPGGATLLSAAGCDVTYNITSQWNNGFVADVTIKNTGAAIDGWTLTWAFASDQRITNLWNGISTQSGQNVSVKDAGSNKVIASGGTANFGFQASYSGTNVKPTSFTLNGMACGGTPPTNTPVAQPTNTAIATPTRTAITTPSRTAIASPTRTATPTRTAITTPTRMASATPISTPTSTTTPPVGCTGAVICDDFESQAGTTPSGQWSVIFPSCQGTGTVAVDTSQAHSGSKSIVVHGGAGFCNHVFFGNTTAVAGIGATIFGRFFVRHTTALPVGHVTFVAMKDANDSAKDLRMGGQNQALQWNRESDDATLPEQSPAGVAKSIPLPTNTWSCVEFMVDGRNGFLQTWVGGQSIEGLHVDGVATQDVDGQWLRRANWRPQLTDLKLGWESYADGVDTLWFDDVALGASRIGCGS